MSHSDRLVAAAVGVFGGVSLFLVVHCTVVHMRCSWVSSSNACTACTTEGEEFNCSVKMHVMV